MLSCSDEEILTELLHHLKFPTETILPNSITILCVLPRGTAPLLRVSSDRLQIGYNDELGDLAGGAQMVVRRLMGLEQVVQMEKGKKSSRMGLFRFFQLGMQRCTCSGHIDILYT